MILIIYLKRRPSRSVNDTGINYLLLYSYSYIKHWLVEISPSKWTCRMDSFQTGAYLHHVKDIVRTGYL